MKRVFQEDAVVEFCTYIIQNQLFMAKFERQALGEVSILERNITGLDQMQVFDLEWW